MAQPTLSQQFTALGDKTRYAIIVSLAREQGFCVSELARRLNMTPAAVSQHMKILETAGVVRPARDGRKVCSELNLAMPNVAALAELIKKEENI